jgi:hypothetical protein
LAWVRRRRRAGSTGSHGDSAGLILQEVPPRDRLVALAGSIRESLVLQFGAAWRAKTTEEVSTDVQLAEQLGPEGLLELIDFLDRIDHLKFAPERFDQGDGALQEALAAWEPRVAVLTAQIRAKPRRRSGKTTLDQQVSNSRSVAHA